MTWDEMDKEYGHNLTTYSSYEEMKTAEAGLPFEEETENGCWNCIEFDGDRCHKEWNNNDDCYYIKWRDDKDPWDCCEDWQEDENAVWEDYFGEDY